ncbi:MAG: T9SS type A sorting domain-containing protein [Bacteroidales bacterium]|nr:T9SS type A sorting domain-containing protein [Bacteroidales bacterium]
MIIEPECHTAENIRVTTDSAGCVNVKWDTLKYQRQWVLRLDGPGGTRYDTVDTNVFTYCGININAHYELSILTQCYRPGGHNYSSWSAPLTIGNGSAAIDDVSISNFQFSVFPNPTDGTVTVRHAATDGSLTLTDLQGRTISEFKIQNSELEIDLSRLPQGTYLLTLTTPDGTATQRVVKK